VWTAPEAIPGRVVEVLHEQLDRCVPAELGGPILIAFGAYELDHPTGVLATTVTFGGVHETDSPGELLKPSGGALRDRAMKGLPGPIPSSGVCRAYRFDDGFDLWLNLASRSRRPGMLVQVPGEMVQVMKVTADEVTHQRVFL
jgi:hypothetical protein